MELSRGKAGQIAWRWVLMIGLVVATLSGSGAAVEPTDAADAHPSRPSPRTVEQLRVEVINSYPHDPTAFTQGLELHNGVLYEGTGLYGQSEIRTVDPWTGQVTRRVPLPEGVFGEGITLVGDHIWQLTWQEGTAYLRDRNTLTQVGQASYTGEGWGLCYDRHTRRLVMSNGSAELTFRDPRSFHPTGSVTVTLNGEPVYNINELECVNGMVWANIWLEDRIVRIDPRTGAVTAVVDASGLLTAEERANADVLNGIAAVPGGDTFLITGKLWPRMFLVRFVPA